MSGDTPLATLPERDVTPADVGPACSATKAFTLAWLLPATTARMTAHLVLPKAFAVHVVASLLTVVMVFLFAWDDLTREITRAYERESTFFIAMVFMTLAGVEIAFAAGAALVMPWGARDEPVRASYANALRQTWLRTSHLLPIVLAIGLLIVSIEDLSSQWRNYAEQMVLALPPMPLRPLPPATRPVSPEAMQAYQNELRQWQVQQRIGSIPDRQLARVRRYAARFPPALDAAQLCLAPTGSGMDSWEKEVREGILAPAVKGFSPADQQPVDRAPAYVRKCD